MQVSLHSKFPNLVPRIDLKATDVGTLLLLMEATFRSLLCKPRNWGNEQGSDPFFAYLQRRSRTTLRSLGMIANAKKELRTRGRSEPRQDSWDSWCAKSPSSIRPDRNRKV